MAICAVLLLSLPILALIFVGMIEFAYLFIPRSYWDRNVSDLRRRGYYYTGSDTRPDREGK